MKETGRASCAVRCCVASSNVAHPVSSAVRHGTARLPGRSLFSCNNVYRVVHSIQPYRKYFLFTSHPLPLALLYLYCYPSSCPYVLSCFTYSYLPSLSHSYFLVCVLARRKSTKFIYIWRWPTVYVDHCTVYIGVNLPSRRCTVCAARSVRIETNQFLTATKQKAHHHSVYFWVQLGVYFSLQFFSYIKYTSR